MMHIQGGGWCISLQDCLARSKTNLGSSSTWAANPQYASADGGEHGWISPDPAVNPLFHDWTQIFVGCVAPGPGMRRGSPSWTRAASLP
jgi:hypothetical protein